MVKSILSFDVDHARSSPSPHAISLSSPLATQQISSHNTDTYYIQHEEDPRVECVTARAPTPLSLCVHRSVQHHLCLLYVCCLLLVRTLVIADQGAPRSKSFLRSGYLFGLPSAAAPSAIQLLLQEYYVFDCLRKYLRPEAPPQG